MEADPQGRACRLIFSTIKEEMVDGFGDLTKGAEGGVGGIEPVEVGVEASVC